MTQKNTEAEYKAAIHEWELRQTGKRTAAKRCAALATAVAHL